MPEPADSSLSRRGAWIGLRTLRQRPKIVDHTPSGEPIFEVRSVRLLLQPDADHFNRLETCSKCGRNVPGGPVFDLADLDRPSNPLICTTCVQAVAKPTLLRSGMRRPPPKRPALPPKPAEPPAAAPDPKPPEADRPGPAPVEEAERAAKGAAADDDIRQNLQTVTQLIEAQQRDLGALSEAVRETRAELRSATKSQGTLAQAQQQLHERMTAFAEHSQQATSAGAASSEVERDLRHNLQFVTELLQAQQRELSALSASLVETRNDLRAVAESSQTPAPPAPPSAENAQRTESLERGLEEMGARLTDGLARAHAETTDLVAQLRKDVRVLAQAVEAQRHQFEAAGDAGARAELRGLTQAVAGLRRSSSTHLDRLEALEDEVKDLAVRLSSLIDAERALLPATLGDEAADIPGRVAGGGLLDALDRQLRDAEGRLARLSGHSRSSRAE